MALVEVGIEKFLVIKCFADKNVSFTLDQHALLLSAPFLDTNTEKYDDMKTNVTIITVTIDETYFCVSVLFVFLM